MYANLSDNTFFLLFSKNNFIYVFCLNPYRIKYETCNTEKISLSDI